MASIADLNVRIGLIYKDLDKGLERVERNLRASGRRLSALGSDLTVAISAPLGLIGASAIKAAGDLESLQLALRSTFETAGRSIAAADKELENLRKSALAPGLDFEQAVRASIRLQGVEYSAEAARKTIEGVANAVALTGGTSANLESVTVQFSQMISKGKVLSQDLRIIQENMPIISKLMKQAFGTSNAEDIQNLGITGRQFVDRITKEMEKLPRVSGGISNALVNAGTAVKQFLASIGFEINKAFDLTGKSDQFAGFLQDAARAFSELDDSTKKTIVQVGLFVVAAGPVIKIIGVMKSTAAQAIDIFQGMAGGVQTLSGWALSAASAFQKLSLAMKFTVAGAVLAGVTALYFAFQNLSLGVSETGEVMRKAAAAASEERAKTSVLIDVLRDETATREQKAGALKKLQAIAPEYFKNLDAEKSSIQDLNRAYESYIDSILRAARAKAAEEKLIELDKKSIEIQERKNRLLTTPKGNFQGTTGGFGSATAFSQQQAATQKQLIAQADAEAIALKKQMDALKGIIRDNTDFAASNETVAAATEKAALSDKQKAKAARERARADKESAKELGDVIEQLLLLNELDAQAAERNKTPIIPLGGEKKSVFGQPNLAPVTSQTSGKDRATEIGDAIASISLAAQEGLSPIDQLITAIDSKLFTFSESWTELSKTVTDGSGLMGDALATAASAFVTTAASGEASFKSLGQAALQGAAGVVRAKLLESVASVAADAFKKFGILGFIGAAVAGGAVVGLFNKLVSSIKLPGFAQGTDFAPGGLALVGERGPELINLPRGSQVIPNPRLAQLAQGGNNVTVGGTFRIQGTDLVVVLERAQQEAKRIRGF